MGLNRTRFVAVTFGRLLASFSSVVLLVLSVSLNVLPAMSASADQPPNKASGQSSKALQPELAKVEGEVGIAVVDTTRNKRFLFNQGKLFPLQSVVKLPLSIAILRLADAGKLSAQDKITVHQTDIVPYHSPIKDAIKGKQSDFTIRELITRAICDSDNTACDILFAHAGGASEVTRLITEAGVKGVHVDRPEGTLQPESLHIAKFLKDPRDTATPEGMADLLQKLYLGNLLSKQSTAFILEDMFSCKTGPNRIKAGLPAGWKLAHKTGTGADVAGQNTATNDVGVAVGPKGEIIYIAVFVKGSRANIEAREALMAKVAAKAVAGEL